MYGRSRHLLRYAIGMVTIITDTREQKPLDFTPFEGVRVKRAELWPGDYSITTGGCEFAIERKSVSDFVGTMLSGYNGYGASAPKRFNRELLAMRGIVALGGFACVLVEPDRDGESAALEITRHNYKSSVEPSKVLAFANSIRRKWGIDVVYTRSRAESAAYIVERAREAYTRREAESVAF